MLADNLFEISFKVFKLYSHSCLFQSQKNVLNVIHQGQGLWIEQLLLRKREIIYFNAFIQCYNISKNFSCVNDTTAQVWNYLINFKNSNRNSLNAFWKRQETYSIKLRDNINVSLFFFCLLMPAGHSKGYLTSIMTIRKQVAN